MKTIDKERLHASQIKPFVFEGFFVFSPIENTSMV